MEKTLGQISDEILNAVRNLHVSFMGDDRNEINHAQGEFDKMIRVYGKPAVDVAVKYYNENVIAKAGR